MSKLPPEAITVDDIRAAAVRIAGEVIQTPLLENPFINKLAGRRVLIKAECLQRTGSFKIRGGWSAVSNLSPAEKKQGVLAFSSGNHAQGVALAAQSMSVPAVIIMPNDAPAQKIENTKAYGAEVVLYDRPAGENREAIGAALAKERGLVLIKPYDHPMVMAGQGTCGLEIARQAADAGVTSADVLVCCGGGGLTSGVALALESEAPGLRARPVEPEHFDDVVRSQASGERETVDTTRASVCDAVLTPSPGKLTFPVIKRLCKPGIVVTDTEAQRAMAQAMIRLKVVAEPGGSVALAAALYHADAIEGDAVVCIVSGGNTDVSGILAALSLL